MKNSQIRGRKERINQLQIKTGYIDKISISRAKPPFLQTSPDISGNGIEKILISEKLIAKRIKSLASQISLDYKNNHELTVLVVLKGAFVFASDLIREIHSAGHLNVKLEFIAVTTYGNQIKKSGEDKRGVKILLEPENISGKDLLIVEDIIDQGFTLSAIREYLLKSKKAKSVSTCVLLEKDLINPSKEVSELRKNYNCDYIGFKIADQWVAGYGTDAAGDLRHLPFIVVVNEKYYTKKI